MPQNRFHKTYLTKIVNLRHATTSVRRATTSAESSFRNARELNCEARNGVCTEEESLAVEKISGESCTMEKKQNWTSQEQLLLRHDVGLQGLLQAFLKWSISVPQSQKFSGMQRQEDLCEFETSLDYIVSASQDYIDHVKNKTKKQTNIQTNKTN